MLPPTLAGELPPGIHSAALEEFRERFGRSSPRREWLIGRFDALLAQAHATGCLRRVFVWGSFVTEKATPGDLDVLLIMSQEFSTSTLTRESRDAFDATRAKLVFEADVFWAQESIGLEALGLWLDTYQTTRDFRKRGIVELELGWFGPTNKCCRPSNAWRI